MTPEENKALVRRFYAEIDKGSLEAMDELVAENYIDHNPPPFPGLASLITTIMTGPLLTLFARRRNLRADLQAQRTT